MNEEKKSPEVRFPGFEDEWEQRKLSEMAEFSKGSGYSKADIQDEGTPIILYGRLYTNYQAKISSVDTFAEEKPKSVLSKGNEVIVPASGETPEEISRASAVLKDGIILGGDLNIISPDNSIDPVFLATVLSSGRVQKELSSKAQGKAVVHLHNSDIREVTVTFPSLEEQLKINEVFDQLDETITLHRRKLDDLKELKSGFLQKMFPQKGEKVPQVRFPEFTDYWEQRKLGELVQIRSGIAPGKLDEGYVNYFKVDDLNHCFKSLSQSESQVNIPSDIQLIPSNSIVFPKRGAAIMTNKVRILAVNGMIDTNLMALIPTDIQSDFLYFLIEKEGLYKIADTSTIPQINNKHIEPYEVLIPSLEEQLKISGFLNDMDQAITLHQRKIDDLNRLKGGLLQKMFP